MVTRRRKYPVGILTFSEITKKGYVYVDKTDLVWQLVDYAKYIFLRRPRRFGKYLSIREMQSYLACNPYVEGFKKKLEDAATAEEFYEYTLYLIFWMLNVYVRTQVKCRGGRTDMVVWMLGTIYVFELKSDGTAEETLKQIEDKGYAIPYTTDENKVVKVGVAFDAETRTISNWLTETL